MEFIDLKSQYQYMRQDIDKAIQDIVKNADFIMGKSVEQFEAQLATYVGRKYCISCSNGTAALQLIYMAYGIGSGDAVFCPDMTFIASIEPACLLGAVPVFCDIDPQSYNIDLDSLERQLKNVKKEGRLYPRAVVGVDFLGHPIEYYELERFCEQNELLLIEDAAQGMGAGYRDKRCGSLGTISATSFFPSKPLGCYGDGGAVFTDDEDIAMRIRSLRVHGKGTTKYDNRYIGINSRLDSIQAAILSVKLSHLNEEIEQRQRIAAYYDEALKDMYIVPEIASGMISAYAQYSILARDESERQERMNQLQERGIPSIRYYPNPLHMLPVFRGHENYGESYIHTIDYAERSFAIPFSPYITQDDQNHIIQILCGNA